MKDYSKTKKTVAANDKPKKKKSPVGSQLRQENRFDKPYKQDEKNQC